MEKSKEKSLIRKEMYYKFLESNVFNDRSCKSWIFEPNCCQQNVYASCQVEKLHLVVSFSGQDKKVDCSSQVIEAGNLFEKGQSSSQVQQL